jgi:hypothetical protein
VRTLLGADKAAIRRERVPWLTVDRIAILTVEYRADVLAEFSDVGVTAVFEKRDEFEPRDLPLSIHIVKDRLSAQGRDVSLRYYE